MISQAEHPTVDPALDSWSVGGGFPLRVGRRWTDVEMPASVEGFCVEWQLLESPPSRGEGGAPATRAAGGQTA